MGGNTPESMGKGKLGGSEKGAKLTIFPFEEAGLCGELTVGREKGARPLPGLPVGRGSLTCRLTGTGRCADVERRLGFPEDSFCKGWMQVDYRSELLMGRPEAETP